MSLFACSCNYKKECYTVNKIEYSRMRLMIGTKPYKHAILTIEGHELQTLIPEDSSVRIIPLNTTHEFLEGKCIRKEHDILVD